MFISLIDAAESKPANIGGLPLVVDLDGTLIKSDLLIESFFGRIGKDPASIFSLLLALRHGKARFKSVLAESSDFDPAELPYDEAVLDLIKEARAGGRQVYLASASNAKFVAAVARHLGLFTDYFGSDATTNRSAHAKADLLVEAFGEGGFDYIGNDEADLPVWAAASKRIGVRTSPRLAAKLAVLGVDLIETPKATWRSWTKLIRVHQYAKNALVWLPMFAAHKFDPESIFNSLLATMAFSLCASSVYIFNDLVDLSADRNHPTKKNRPLASRRRSDPPGGRAYAASVARVHWACGGGFVAVSGSPLVLLCPNERLYMLFEDEDADRRRRPRHALFIARHWRRHRDRRIGVAVAARLFIVLLRLSRAHQALYRARRSR